MTYEVVDADEVAVDENGNVKTLLAEETDSLSFLRAYLNPGESSPEEDFVIHPDCEQVEYVVYGTGTARYPDGTAHKLQPGTAVYHAAGQPHRFENDSNEPLVYVVATVVGEKTSADRVAYAPDDQ